MLCGNCHWSSSMTCPVLRCCGSQHGTTLHRHQHDRGLCYVTPNLSKGRLRRIRRRFAFPNEVYALFMPLQCCEAPTGARPAWHQAPGHQGASPRELCRRASARGASTRCGAITGWVPRGCEDLHGRLLKLLRRLVS